MKRRAFLTMLSAIPAFAVMPVVALEARRAPRTAAELEQAIEGLYAHVDVPSQRAFEEFCAMGNDMFAYRVLHGTWAKRGHSEAELVADAWRDVVVGADGFEDGTLIWRRKPVLTVERDFEDDLPSFKLRFRFGVLPADWRQRAERSARMYDLPGWRGTFATRQGRLA